MNRNVPRKNGGCDSIPSQEVHISRVPFQTKSWTEIKILFAATVEVLNLVFLLRTKPKPFKYFQKGNCGETSVF